MVKERRQASRYLSELTAVAYDTVYEATSIARQGYTESLRSRLEANDAWTRGWFAEGIAQGLYLHDLKRDNHFEHTQRFVGDSLDRVCKLAAYVGMGLAIAHTGVFSETLYSSLDRRQCSWVFDGVGFYKLMVAEQPDHSHVELPDYLGDEDERAVAFHAGVGRGLWFAVGETQLELLTTLIDTFPEYFRPSVWRGVGFASTYAGGSPSALETLRSRAGNCRDFLKIGAVIAILEQGDEQVPHREIAARTYLARGINETLELLAPSDPMLSAEGRLQTDATSVSWMENVLATLA